MLVLAERLHMTVGDLMRRMDTDELVDWLTFLHEDAPDEDVIDLSTADPEQLAGLFG